jgi:hypothetical protein
MDPKLVNRNGPQCAIVSIAVRPLRLAGLPQPQRVYSIPLRSLRPLR